MRSSPQSISLILLAWNHGITTFNITVQNCVLYNCDLISSIQALITDVIFIKINKFNELWWKYACTDIMRDGQPYFCGLKNVDIQRVLSVLVLVLYCNAFAIDIKCIISWCFYRLHKNIWGSYKTNICQQQQPQKKSCDIFTTLYIVTVD